MYFVDGYLRATHASPLRVQEQNTNSGCGAKFLCTGDGPTYVILRGPTYVILRGPTYVILRGPTYVILRGPTYVILRGPTYVILRGPTYVILRGPTYVILRGPSHPARSRRIRARSAPSPARFCDCAQNDA